MLQMVDIVTSTYELYELDVAFGMCITHTVDILSPLNLFHVLQQLLVNIVRVSQ